MPFWVPMMVGMMAGGTMGAIFGGSQSPPEPSEEELAMREQLYADSEARTQMMEAKNRPTYERYGLVSSSDDDDSVLGGSGGGSGDGTVLGSTETLAEMAQVDPVKVDEFE